MNGLTTCVEAVQHYIDRIQARTDLNAWLEVYAEEALTQAQAIDDTIKSQGIAGPMQGVVIGLKDVICYKGHSITGASQILQGFTSIYNATATQRLLEAGAIIIGRQNCDEFAMGGSNENSAYGPVKNAADTSRVPGGSSGGSAVSVQAGMCMVSLGSDTGGSVRQPADFCGIVGLKPSYGTVSRYGLIAYASSFDQIGIFANSVADVALTLEVIAGPDEFDSTVSHQKTTFSSPEISTPDRPYRIAYFKNAIDHPSLDPEIAHSIRVFIEKLTSEGQFVEAVDFELIDHIVPTYYVLTTAEASSNLSRYDGVKYGRVATAGSTDLTTYYKENRSLGFGAEVKRRILLGTFVLSSGYYDDYFAKAQKVRQLLKIKTEALFQQYDAIILPTVPTPAFKIGEKNDDPIAMFLGDIYTVYANLVGIPAISLPLFTHSSGLPFGLQVMSSQFNELLLLHLSKMMTDISGR